MYYVIETKTSGDDGTVNAVTTQTLEDAESEYYGILREAARSNYDYHGAMLLTEDCKLMMSRSYKHKIEEESDGE